MKRVAHLVSKLNIRGLRVHFLQIIRFALCTEFHAVMLGSENRSGANVKYCTL